MIDIISDWWILMRSTQFDRFRVHARVSYPLLFGWMFHVHRLMMLVCCVVLYKQRQTTTKKERKKATKWRVFVFCDRFNALLLRCGHCQTTYLIYLFKIWLNLMEMFSFFYHCLRICFTHYINYFSHLFCVLLFVVLLFV